MVNKTSDTAQVEAYVAALERETEGYESRLAALAAGKPERLDKEQLAARLKQVAAEIRRAKRLLAT